MAVGGRGAGMRRLGTLCLAAIVVSTLAACGTTPATKPTSARKPPPSQRLAGDWYRVRKGDSLWSIAWRLGVDYRTLARWNGLKAPYTIYPGQLLRLKPPKTTVHKGRRASRKPAAKPPRAQTAKKGSAVSSKSGAGSKGVRRLYWHWPLRGEVVSRFSPGDPERKGIKIAGRRGQPVRAAESGTVVYSGSGLIGYGQLIIIKHNNEFLSAYGHNSRLLVKEGQSVKRGQHIADLGVNRAGKPLLHFEIRRYGKPVDPLTYLPRG